MSFATEHEIAEAQKASHASVEYEHPASDPRKHCGNCRNFIPARPNRCRTVQAPIRPEDWCKRYEPEEASEMAADKEYGSAMAKAPKKEKESEGGEKEKGKKKVHHIEVHPSHSGGHIAVHKHAATTGEPMPEDEMHSVSQGGMDEHLAAHLPGGAPAEEPDGGEGAGGGEGAPAPGEE